MNDVFYFIYLCDLANYAGDNTILQIIASAMEVVLAAFKQHTENVIKWFIKNVMQVNPFKFQCMFLKPSLTKAVTQIKYFMYQFKVVFDLNERKIIYNSLRLSSFNYCPIIEFFWGNMHTEN